MTIQTSPVFHSPPAFLSCTRAEAPPIQSWCPRQDRCQSSTGRGYRGDQMRTDLLGPARCRQSSHVDQCGRQAFQHLQYHTQSEVWCQLSHLFICADNNQRDCLMFPVALLSSSVLVSFKCSLIIVLLTTLVAVFLLKFEVFWNSNIFYCRTAHA